MMMTENSTANNSEIIFDVNSGISVEEQQVILEGINSIAEKNRRSLSGSSPDEHFKASKNSGLFPIVVNAAAVLLLAGGFLTMFFLHGGEDVQLRLGTRVYNSAERALIDEIRKETSQQIEEKETEIAEVVLKMEDIDAQLQSLHSDNLELTAEQSALEENLHLMQEEHRQSLANLQDERSRILENSRARVAALNAQLEERNREISALSERSEAELNLAYSQLERLNTEQEKAAAVEAQLGAFFQMAAGHIQNGRLTEAGEALVNMRAFLNTPAFQELRAVQARREVYTRSINVMEAMIEEARRNQEALAAARRMSSTEGLEELLVKNTQLEETIAGLNRSLSAVDSEGSNLSRRLIELEESTAALRTLNSALETSITEYTQTIADMESQNAGLTQTVAVRENVIRELQAENASQEEQIVSLDTQLTSLRQALQALSQ